MNTQPTKKHRLKYTIAIVVGALLVPVIATPAHADSAAITGQVDGNNIVRYYSQVRHNYQPHNHNFFTNKGNTMGGGKISIAMRPTASPSGTYARGTAYSYGETAVIRHDNGNSWTSPGTFYLSASTTGGCGEPGCDEYRWYADFYWNVPYIA